MAKLFFSNGLRRELNLSVARTFVTSTCVCGRKTRIPFDRRFIIRPKDVAPHKEGGSLDVVKDIGKSIRYPAPPGYFKNGRFHLVKEMIPEFVVPDLNNFKLKPYVSYRVPDIKQSEFTSKDLFNATYGRDIIQDYKSGTFNPDDVIKKTLSKSEPTEPS